MNENAAANVPAEVAERILAEVAEWHPDTFRQAFGFDLASASTDRDYTIGIPLAITVKGDGAIVLDFDLSEAEQIGDSDDEPYDRYGEDVVVEDSKTLRRHLAAIGYHHSITLTPNA